MRTIKIHGQGGVSRIVIGESFRNLGAYTGPRRTIIVTDENVRRLYGKSFESLDVVTLGTGEEIKTLDTVKLIYRRLMDIGAERSAFVVGFGGGIVCDVTGFAASTFLRGIDFAFVPSTLLAQVDASIGGKNGVNLCGYKNMVGLVNQPSFVLCDIELLDTLPPRELTCGFAEVVKYALIGDAGLFRFLESDAGPALSRERRVLERIVSDAACIKAAIVERDERDRGERRKLNFGHTFGHAIESVAGMPHGEAIGAGIALSADLSVKYGLLRDDEARRIHVLLERMGITVDTRIVKHDAARIFDAIRKDKKREGDKIHFVFLAGIGHAVVEETSLAALEEAVHDLR